MRRTFANPGVYVVVEQRDIRGKWLRVFRFPDKCRRWRRQARAYHPRKVDFLHQDDFHIFNSIRTISDSISCAFCNILARPKESYHNKPSASLHHEVVAVFFHHSLAFWVYDSIRVCFCICDSIVIKKKHRMESGLSKSWIQNSMAFRSRRWTNWKTSSRPFYRAFNKVKSISWPVKLWPIGKNSVHFRMPIEASDVS